MSEPTEPTITTELLDAVGGIDNLIELLTAPALDVRVTESVADVGLVRQLEALHRSAWTSTGVRLPGDLLLGREHDGGNNIDERNRAFS